MFFKFVEQLLLPGTILRYLRLKSFEIWSLASKKLLSYVERTKHMIIATQYISTLLGIYRACYMSREHEFPTYPNSIFLLSSHCVPYT